MKRVICIFLIHFILLFSCKYEHKKVIYYYTLKNSTEKIKVIEIQKSVKKIFKEYYPNDTLFREYFKINDTLEGKYKEFYRNGKHRFIYNYKHGE